MDFNINNLSIEQIVALQAKLKQAKKVKQNEIKTQNKLLKEQKKAEILQIKKDAKDKIDAIRKEAREKIALISHQKTLTINWYELFKQYQKHRSEQYDSDMQIIKDIIPKQYTSSKLNEQEEEVKEEEYDPFVENFVNPEIHKRIRKTDVKSVDNVDKQAAKITAAGNIKIVNSQEEEVKEEEYDPFVENFVNPEIHKRIRKTDVKSVDKQAAKITAADNIKIVNSQDEITAANKCYMDENKMKSNKKESDTILTYKESDILFKKLEKIELNIIKKDFNTEDFIKEEERHEERLKKCTYMKFVGNLKNDNTIGYFNKILEVKNNMNDYVEYMYRIKRIKELEYDILKKYHAYIDNYSETILLYEPYYNKFDTFDGYYIKGCISKEFNGNYTFKKFSGRGFRKYNYNNDPVEVKVLYENKSECLNHIFKKIEKINEQDVKITVSEKYDEYLRKIIKNRAEEEEEKRIENEIKEEERKTEIKNYEKRKMMEKFMSQVKFKSVKITVNNLIKHFSSNANSHDNENKKEKFEYNGKYYDYESEILFKQIESNIIKKDFDNDRNAYYSKILKEKENMYLYVKQKHNLNKTKENIVFDFFHIYIDNRSNSILLYKPFYKDFKFICLCLNGYIYKENEENYKLMIYRIYDYHTLIRKITILGVEENLSENKTPCLNYFYNKIKQMDKKHGKITISEKYEEYLQEYKENCKYTEEKESNNR